MPMEGLFAKLGSSAVRELGPHLPRLVGGVLDRFRKDTDAMRDALHAEIKALGEANSSLAGSMFRQADAMELWQTHLIEIECKLDHVAASQDSIAQQLVLHEKQMRTLRVLLFLTLVVLLLMSGAIFGLYFLRR